MIVANGHRYRTLADKFYVNGSQVKEAYVNGIKVYPETGHYATLLCATTIVDTHSHNTVPPTGWWTTGILAFTIYYDRNIVCSATYHATAQAFVLLQCDTELECDDFVTTKYGRAGDEHLVHKDYWHTASAITNEQDMFGYVVRSKGNKTITMRNCRLSGSAHIPTCSPIKYEQRHEGFLGAGYDGSHAWTTSASNIDLAGDDVAASLKSGSGGVVGISMRGTTEVTGSHSFTTYSNGAVSNVDTEQFTSRESLFLGCVPFTSVLYIGDDLDEALSAGGFPPQAEA